MQVQCKSIYSSWPRALENASQTTQQNLLLARGTETSSPTPPAPLSFPFCPLVPELWDPSAVGTGVGGHLLLQPRALQGTGTFTPQLMALQPLPATSWGVAPSPSALPILEDAWSLHGGHGLCSRLLSAGAGSGQGASDGEGDT